MLFCCLLPELAFHALGVTFELNKLKCIECQSTHLFMQTTEKFKLVLEII